MDFQTIMKKHVVVLSGLTYPVPPIRGGGPQIVLYNTCLKIFDPDIDWKILANWEPELDQLQFDRSKIIAIKTTWLDKLALKLVNLLPYRLRKSIFSEVGDQERLILNIKILRKLFSLKKDIIVCHESYSLAYLVHLIFPRKKMITYIHNSKVHLDFDPEMWRRYVKASTSGMILGSQVSINDLQAKFGTLPSRTWVIYNGIDSEKFNIEQRNTYRKENLDKYGISEQDFVFIYCGRIAPIKNIDLILDAFLELAEEMPNIKLVIVGSADKDNYGDILFQDKLHQMAAGKNQTKVTFSGFISQEHLPEIYSVADCGVLGTKEKQETLTLFLLECLASGIPVIAPALGAIPEVIRNGKEGMIIPREYTQTELVYAMRQMVNQEADWSERSQNIAKYIQDNFSWQRVADDFVRVLKEV